MKIGKMKTIKTLKTDEAIALQNMADELTDHMMRKKYGERFEGWEDVEADPHLQCDWNNLNVEFYNIIFKFLYATWTMSESEMQSFADTWTSDLLKMKYGQRFIDCEDITEDKEMDADWERINEKLYNVIYQINNETF